MQVADAGDHFDRAVGISYGQFLGSTSEGASGGNLPLDVTKMIDSFSGIAGNYQVKASNADFHRANIAAWSSPLQFTGFAATTIHDPIVYLPGAAAIFVSRFFTNRVIVSYYFLEVTNLLLFLLIIWWSLKQFHLALSLVMAALSLLPMVVSMTVSPNPDGILFALSVAFAACTYRGYVAEDPKSPTDSDRLIVLWHIKRLDLNIFTNDLLGWGVLAILALDKPPYACLGFLIALGALCANRFKEYFVKVFAGLGLIAILEFLWLELGARGSGALPTSGGISPPKQLRFLWADPLRLLSIPVHTLILERTSYWQMAIGRLGWLDTPLPNWYYSTATLIIGTLTILLLMNSRLRLRPILACLASVIVGLLLVFLTLYVDWTPVGIGYVDGVQGRYFLPFLPAILLCLGLVSRKPQRMNFFGVTILVGLGLLTETAMILALLFRYWWA